MVFGFFKKKSKAETQEALQPSKLRLRDKISSLFTTAKALDEESLEELQEILIAADVSYNMADDILLSLKKKYENELVKDHDQLMNRLQLCLIEMFEGHMQAKPIRNENGMTITLIVGVNGSGKTTSIAKLCAAWKNEGRKVMLAAGDTFRAAASAQLATWADRINVDIVKHHEGADPSALVFDALKAAEARDIDDLIIDTAGRLHTDNNLMAELEKIRRTIQRKFPDAPHETLLVLDATAGQNALSQAKLFSEKVPLTGLVLAKLDGTARGGIVFTIAKEAGVPVKYVGTGEQPENLELFNIETFVEALVQ
jgi:fused signal recognition particle receptor